MGGYRQVRVAVVCGGTSAEAGVSRVSGAGVAEALRTSFDAVSVIELDRDVGRRLLDERTGVVFPALHGGAGEDGTFQGFLETMGIPYVGSGVRASAAAMDKTLAKRVFASAGLPVAADAVAFRRRGAPAEAERVAGLLGDDVVVKPSSQGSALGVSFARDRRALREALEKAFAYGDAALVEQRVAGREITVGVLERDPGGAEALPVVEVVTPEGTWYDFEHRYTQGLSRHLIPARLDGTRSARAQEVAVLAHQHLGCRDLSRVDFVAPESGDPVLLEVNTLPGMTPTSLFPDAARAVGISFQELVAHLVRRALARAGLA